MLAIETNWGEIEKLRNKAVYYDAKYKRDSFFPKHFENPSVDRRMAIMSYIKKLFPLKGIYWEDLSLNDFCSHFALQKLERRQQLMRVVNNIFKYIEKYEYKFQSYDLHFRLDDGSLDCPYIITLESNF
jgi:hypothetical protein